MCATPYELHDCKLDPVPRGVERFVSRFAILRVCRAKVAERIRLFISRTLLYLFNALIP